MDDSDSYYEYSDNLQKTIRMFLDWMNDDRGGLIVGGKRYGMRFVWVGDGSSKQQVTKATAQSIRGHDADFAFAGYSSGLSLYAAKQSYAENKVMLTWGAGTPLVHSQNNLTFGTAAPATIYTRSGILAIAAAADEIDAGTREPMAGRCEASSCKASLQVGVIRADAVFPAACAIETPQQVADAGLAMTMGADGEILLPIVATSPQVDDVIQALTQLRDAGTNVLVGCTYAPTGRVIIEALEMMDWSPLAVVLTSTVTAASFAHDRKCTRNLQLLVIYGFILTHCL
jgi:hypothetical protein